MKMGEPAPHFLFSRYKKQCSLFSHSLENDRVKRVGEPAFLFQPFPYGTQNCPILFLDSARMSPPRFESFPEDAKTPTLHTREVDTPLGHSVFLAPAFL